MFFATILLISGDVDFALALHKLGQRGYTVVHAIPSGVGVSPALSNPGQFVWYWHSIARGEGLVSAESSLSRSFSSDDSDLPNDEEAVVHKGMPQNRYIVGTSSTQTCTINSTQIAPEFNWQDHLQMLFPIRMKDHLMKLLRSTCLIVYCKILLSYCLAFRLYINDGMQKNLIAAYLVFKSFRL